MSSRSKGVTKVLLSMTRISWVSASPSFSVSLMRRASSARPAVSAATSFASSSAATTMFSAALENNG
jgi:hypothetical protein